jgi:pantoate--beta-alanine ligase
MAPSITTLRTVQNLRAQLAKWREDGERIALVPTMGALHAGHLSLIAIARSNADRVVASIFVNPAQFGPREDLARYPRDEAGDVGKLAAAGVDLVFIPETAEMYPSGFATRVSLPSLTDDLCGASRPNHFEGVATVVTKLLLQCAPDVAVFGEKDYQQLLMIKRLVRDLDIPLRIVAGPIVREADGLALSSRNSFLSSAEREAAPLLVQTLRDVASSLAEGRGCDDAAESGRFKLEAKGFRVDYVAIRDPETLAPLSGPIKGPARVLGAVYLGKTRLIDNVPTEAKSR